VLAGVTILGLFFVGLGIYFISYCFSNYYNVPGSNSVDGGGYLIFGPVGIVLGAGLLWYSLPVFIPIKQKPQPKVKTCPSCGAIVEENAAQCEKCKNQLSDT